MGFWPEKKERTGDFVCPVINICIHIDVLLVNRILNRCTFLNAALLHSSQRSFWKTRIVEGGKSFCEYLHRNLECCPCKTEGIVLFFFSQNDLKQYLMRPPIRRIEINLWFSYLLCKFKVLCGFK